MVNGWILFGTWVQTLIISQNLWIWSSRNIRVNERNSSWIKPQFFGNTVPDSLNRHRWPHLLKLGCSCLIYTSAARLRAKSHRLCTLIRDFAIFFGGYFKLKKCDLSEFHQEQWVTTELPFFFWPHPILLVTIVYDELNTTSFGSWAKRKSIRWTPSRFRLNL